MIVREVIEVLKGMPDHMLVMFDDGENGRRLVTKVAIDTDQYYSELNVVVIGRKAEGKV